LDRRYSLRGREQFGRLYQQGRLWSGTGLKIRYLEQPTATPLFAFSAPRTAGKAVARNRARRVIREVVRHQLAGWPGGFYHFRIGDLKRVSDSGSALELVAAFRSALGG
jgi:ribonuclease P protein component